MLILDNSLTPPLHYDFPLLTVGACTAFLGKENTMGGEWECMGCETVLRKR
jgi:hypothetical protein